MQVRLFFEFIGRRGKMRKKLKLGLFIKWVIIIGLVSFLTSLLKASSYQQSASSVLKVKERIVLVEKKIRFRISDDTKEVKYRLLHIRKESYYSVEK